MFLLLFSTLSAQVDKNSPIRSGVAKVFKNLSKDKQSASKQPLNISAYAIEGEQMPDGVYRILAMEGVYIWQGDRQKPILELVCDQSVVWIKPEKDMENKSPDDKSSNLQLGALEKAMFYAEGNAHFQWGDKSIKGDQIFFDLIANRGLIVHGAIRTSIEYRKKQIPLHMRAHKLWIYSQEKFTAQNASISTCQFGDPHYHFAASEITVIKRLKEISVESYDNTLYALGIPLFYVPYLAGTFSEDWPLKSLKPGRSSKYGVYLYTTLGGKIYAAPQDPGPTYLKKLNWLLDLDIRERRGIAVSPQLKYRGVYPQKSTFNGETDIYYLRDQPLGKLGSSKTHSTNTSREVNRYRFYTLHRQSFPDDYLFTLELSHISDRNLLIDFFEKEAREAKEQETYAHLKKTWGSQTVTALGRINLNDFQTQVAYLPQVTYQAIYEPLLQDIPDLYWSSRAEFSNVIRQDDQNRPTQFDDRRVMRVDWNNTLSYRINLDPIYVLPFVGGRLSYFEEQKDGQSDIDRQTGEMGVEVSTHFYRTFRWQSRILNIDRIFHVCSPSFRYQWIYANNVLPDLLIPYDDMETVDKGQVLSFRLTNRLQTIRRNRIVDYLFLEVEFSYFPNRDLFKQGIKLTPLKLPVSNRWEKFDNLSFDLQWWIYENVSLNARAQYNFQANELETGTARISYTPIPNLQCWVDARYQLKAVEPTHNSGLAATAALNYTINPKWGVSCYLQYNFLEDFHRNEFREFQFTVRRTFHRFALDLKFKRDFVDHDTSFTAEFYPLDLVDKKTFLRR